MPISSQQLSSSLSALTKEYETITSNLANINTAGFKRRCNSFTKSLAEKMGNSAIDSKTQFDFSQGHLVHTGNHLDWAMSGKGFFTIETPDGPLYSRNGIFKVNNKGQIVDLEGRLLAGKDGALVLPESLSVTDITVSEDGFVKAGENTMGQLKIADFGKDEAKLVPVGKNCWAPPSFIKPKEVAEISIKQGYQESSNVEMVDEMVDLITVSRMYQSNMKMMTADTDNTKSILGVAMG
ncbi:MAG: hypothetical protein A2Y07_09300 [Planctomycetes bacterium GWF2_50_10]|nr:MAG: hypothetical protein A2Y07_09300 [Planctomycetes bacterium GWF2_50_10]